MTPAERRPLTRALILEQALDLVDEHGLEWLSMRKLGASLGVEAMSLYNHVDNKDDVLDGMLDLVMRDIELPPPELGWRDRVRHLVREVRRVSLEHPGVILLHGIHPVLSARGFAPVEAMHAALEEAGFGQDRSIDAFVLVVAFIMGFMQVDRARLAAPTRDVDMPYRGWVGAEHERAVRLGLTLVHQDWDQEFERSLALVIEALEALADAHGPAPA